MQQARLCDLQLAQRFLCDVPRRADLRFGHFALGNVTIYQNKAAARDRVVADLERPAVRPCPLGRPLMAGILGETARFRLGINRAKLAALCEIADAIVVTTRLGEKPIRQVEDFHEIAVPRSQPPLLVEPDDTVAHIVEAARPAVARAQPCAPRPAVPDAPPPRRARPAAGRVRPRSGETP